MQLQMAHLSEQLLTASLTTLRPLVAAGREGDTGGTQEHKVGIPTGDLARVFVQFIGERYKIGVPVASGAKAGESAAAGGACRKLRGMVV